MQHYATLDAHAVASETNTLMIILAKKVHKKHCWFGTMNYYTAVP